MTISRVATLTADVVVNTGNMDKTLNDIKASLDKTKASIDAFVKANGAATTATNATNASLKQTQAQQRAVISESANLGRALRVWTTEMLGVNTVTIALGTALGNLATQAVSQLFVAIKNAIVQFSELHNALTLVAGVGAKASDSMQVILDVARSSGSSIRDLHGRYVELINTFQGSGATIDRVNEAFRRQEEALSGIRQNTVGGAMSKFIDSIGAAVMGFDRLVGASNLLIGALNVASGIMQGIGALARFLENPFGADRSISTRVQVLRGVRELELELAEINREQLRIDNDRITAMGARGRLGRDEAQLARDRAEVERRLAIARADAALADVRAQPIIEAMTRDLGARIGMARELTREQQIRLQVLALENQLLAAGLTLDQARAKAAEQAGLIRQAFAAQELQGLRQTLIGPEQVERESYKMRTDALREFYQGRADLAAEYNSLLEAENARHQAELTLIQARGDQMVFQAQAAALNEAVNLLNVFGSKNKTAAIAALAIQKGLAIAQVAISIPVMQAQAIKELGVVAGTPVAAAIGVWGGIQMALIAATGIAQAAQIAKGTPTGGGGGGSGSPSTPAAPDAGQMPQRIVIEPVDPAMIFTGEQLNNLIGVINEKAQNGTVVVATKLI